MEPKFNVGDKAIVKDIPCTDVYGKKNLYLQPMTGAYTLAFSEKMRRYVGQVFTVTKVAEHRHGYTYSLDAPGYWVWSDEFLDNVSNKAVSGRLTTIYD